MNNDNDNDNDNDKKYTTKKTVLPRFLGDK